QQLRGGKKHGRVRERRLAAHSRELPRTDAGEHLHAPWPQYPKSGSVLLGFGLGFEGGSTTVRAVTAGAAVCAACAAGRSGRRRAVTGEEVGPADPPAATDPLEPRLESASTRFAAPAFVGAGGSVG